MKKGVVIGLAVVVTAAVAAGIAVAVSRGCNDGLMVPDCDDFEEEEEELFEDDLDEDSKAP